MNGALPMQVENGPLLITSFGTHRLPGCAVAHSCSDRLASCASGIDDVGTQCARVPQHAANGFGASFGPVSQDCVHAPVAVPSSGSKHGVHLSVIAQTSCGSRSAWSLTCGITVDR